MMSRRASRSFTYQDALRAVGAWLDVRGYREVRIVEDGGALVVEASPSAPAPVEVLRFDAERMHRLREAALSDRGAPRVFSSQELNASAPWDIAPPENESPPAHFPP
jgi:hypothetical protein